MLYWTSCILEASPLKIEGIRTDHIKNFFVSKLILKYSFFPSITGTQKQCFQICNWSVADFNDIIGSITLSMSANLSRKKRSSLWFLSGTHQNWRKKANLPVYHRHVTQYIFNAFENSLIFCCCPPKLVPGAKLSVIILESPQQFGKSALLVQVLPKQFSFLNCSPNVITKNQVFRKLRLTPSQKLFQTICLIWVTNFKISILIDFSKIFVRFHGSKYCYVRGSHKLEFLFLLTTTFCDGKFPDGNICSATKDKSKVLIFARKGSGFKLIVLIMRNPSSSSTLNILRSSVFVTLS